MIEHHNSGRQTEEQAKAEAAAQKRLLDEFFNRAERAYPNGQAGADDEGETAFAIASDPRFKIVRIQFTKPMNWIGLDVKSARHMAKLLSEKADELERA